MATIGAEHVGMWDYHLNYHRSDQVRNWAAELEERGLASIWVGEARFRDPFTFAGVLLAATKDLTVATGIANIWVRDAFATTAAQLTLAEAYPGRFLLGIGVSHAALIEDVRGHRYSRPLSTMRTYLDDMDMAWDSYRATKPRQRPPRVIAALGPKMLELAAERANGAHTYFAPPEHTHLARRILGPNALLIPEQAVVLDDNPQRARQLARSHIRRYLPLPNYVNNLRRLGFTDRDFVENGSDRLVESIVAYGNPDVVKRYVRAHHEAGATHVCLHVISSKRHEFPIDQWRGLLTDRNEPGQSTPRSRLAGPAVG